MVWGFFLFLSFVFGLFDIVGVVIEGFEKLLEFVEIGEFVFFFMLYDWLEFIFVFKLLVSKFGLVVGEFRVGFFSRFKRLL